MALFVTEQKANGFQDTPTSRHRTIDGDHGRIETRTTTVIEDIAWLKARHPWPGLKTVIVVDSTREIGARAEHEMRLYIASLELDAEALGPIIRAPWAIECPTGTRSVNSLHWIMDMTFRDDECRLRTEHAPANFTTIRHIAHNLIRKAPGKDSFRLRRKVAASDDDFLASLLTA